MSGGKAVSDHCAVVKSFDFHPEILGSILDGGNFFKKTQIFLITRGFQKFWQKTWNQQLLFYYSVRRGSVVQCSDSRSSNALIKYHQIHVNDAAFFSKPQRYFKLSNKNFSFSNSCSIFFSYLDVKKWNPIFGHPVKKWQVIRLTSKGAKTKQITKICFYSKKFKTPSLPAKLLHLLGRLPLPVPPSYRGRPGCRPRLPPFLEDTKQQQSF